METAGKTAVFVTLCLVLNDTAVLRLRIVDSNIHVLDVPVYQVGQLVEAREADPDLGFMARMMVLCSLPRTNPGNRLRYVRQNGPLQR